MTRTVALDFDGVLHDYRGWNGGKLNGPLPGALGAVLALLASGFAVVIHSTREPGVIRGWLERYGFPPLEVVREKPLCVVLVDDRAMTFGGEWSEDLIQRIAHFRAHWES